MESIFVVSDEFIKPSSKTLLEKAVHRLSWMDQLAPHAHISLVFFYPFNDRVCRGDGSDEMLRHLRASFSETLSIFYPLAGRMKDGLFLSCNDEGAAFSEARVGCSLSAVLRRSGVSTVDNLLPCRRHCAGENTSGLVLAVQINIFACGGIAIGACISHKVADGFSLALFLTTWAAISRGGAGAVSPPSFETASIFPPQAEINFPHGAGTGSLESSAVTKLFSLDGAKISALTAAESCEYSAETLTRVEAVSALVWRCLIRARSEETLPRASVATQVVNLRRRMKRALPDPSFGNVWLVAATPGFIPSEEEGIHHLTITQMVSAIRKISGELNEGVDIQPSDGLSRLCKMSEELVARYSVCGVELCCFSSFCGFPLYEVDFGWGGPTWVARGSLHFRNSVTLMPARKREGEEDAGMEAWVSMEAEEMIRFEEDPELLSLLSSAPSPVQDPLIPTSSGPQDPSHPPTPLSEPLPSIPERSPSLPRTEEYSVSLSKTPEFSYPPLLQSSVPPSSTSECSTRHLSCPPLSSPILPAESCIPSTESSSPPCSPPRNNSHSTTPPRSELSLPEVSPPPAPPSKFSFRPVPPPPESFLPSNPHLPLSVTTPDKTPVLMP